MTGYVSVLTSSLREPGVPCAKSMEVSESRMERVNTSQLKFELIIFLFLYHSFIHDSKTNPQAKLLCNSSPKEICLKSFEFISCAFDFIFSKSCNFLSE